MCIDKALSRQSEITKPLSMKISKQEKIVMDDAINNDNGDGLEEPKRERGGAMNQNQLY